MPVRILIVEDFEPFRGIICATLKPRPEFHVVGEASDGLEAVQKATELQPDVILLDIGLPNLSGLQAAKLMRVQSPNARIIFVTQEFSAVVVREALRLGGQGFVHKSSAYGDLISAIDTVLGYKQFVSQGLALNVNHNHPRHVAQFCSDDTVLVESFSRFVATALKAHHAAIIIATKPHREAVEQRLKGDGLNIEGAIQQGTYRPVDVADLVPPVSGNSTVGVKGVAGGLLGVIESAAKATGSQHPRVALGGEGVASLYARGELDAMIRIERSCNELIKTHDVDILCAYPSSVRQSDDATYKSICAEHSAVYPG
jgi:DNA-binding NarL/FixJ family response regulator